MDCEHGPAVQRERDVQHLGSDDNAQAVEQYRPGRSKGAGSA